ncbi:MAG: hypothetical protein Q9228_005744 [Teloschistes exilis]
MFDVESWLPLAVVVLTFFSIFLLSLPSTYGAESHFTSARAKTELRVQIAVLGDIGRSPRIQYHALSIAKHGGMVDLVGYTGRVFSFPKVSTIIAHGPKDSAVHPDIQSCERIKVHSLPISPKFLRTDNRLMFLILAPAKVLLQTFGLYYALGYRTAPAKWLLVQNPPTIPTLLVAQFICFIRNTRLIIDWHNFGYSILALKLGPTHPLVRFSRLFEQVFSARASAHFVVSNAMARQLKNIWHVKGLVIPLHDRPFPQFQPINDSQRRKFLAQCPETAAFAGNIVSGKMRLLVSSTSWTPDEDFSLLLDALISYSELASTTHPSLPDILAIITGKGPHKDAFLWRINLLEKEAKLGKVQIRTAWLSSENYAMLLASADLGVSLHTSSSGVDLPMKVVDMLGAGLPVVGWDKFEAWPELVHEGVNGRGFRSIAGLSDVLVDLFGSDTSELQSLRHGATLEGRRRWDDEWDPVAGKLLELVE